MRFMDSDEAWVGPVNLGNPNECTVAQLATQVLRLTQSQGVLQYQPLPADDPIRRCPDITQAKERLGWHPQVDLQTGLQSTIDYFRSIEVTDT